MNITDYLLDAYPSLGPVGRLDLASWLKDHSFRAPMSSNVPSQQLPFQRWYKFKEAFSPLLVLESLRSLDFEPSTCLDCFGGSGTTALTCQFLGIHPTTVEVNPFLADLIEAKLSQYDSRSLIDDYCTILESVDKVKIDWPNFESRLPKTLVQPGINSRWIYPKETFRRLISYRFAIERIENNINRRLFKVLLGSRLIELSNVYVNGKGRRYRTNWRSMEKHPFEVDMAFKQAFNEAIADIASHGTRECTEYEMVRGDARKDIGNFEELDVALFSPPYPNSFDYTDIYNVELWMLGYLKSSEDNRTLRTATLRSHVQVSRDMSWEHLKSPKLQQTVNKLNSVREKLWDGNIPNMIGAYFADLDTVLRKIRSVINPHGAVFMTVGDSHYADVHVDVGDILQDLAMSAGYNCESIKPIRSMRTSAQQGWRSTLSEDLVCFRPV